MENFITKAKLKKAGITLIALVVTIVILIILAGITLNLVLGNNGIIKRSKDAKEDQEIATEKEQLALAIDDVQSEDMANGGNGSITQGKLQIALNNQLGEGQTTSAKGTTGTSIVVTYTNSGRVYFVSTNGATASKKEIDDDLASDPIVDARILQDNGVCFLIIQRASGRVFYNKISYKSPKYYSYYENINNQYLVSTNGIKSVDVYCLVDNAGKVYTWGTNWVGQLGNGTTTDSDIPICISDISGSALNGSTIVDIKYDEHSVIALDNQGKVYTWGYNGYGQLGNGTTNSSNMPICISDISGSALNGNKIVDIKYDEHSVIALDNQGKVYTWGNNYYGQLGNGTTTRSNIPICISDISGSALNGKIVTYLQHGLALDSDGKVYTWGYNGYGNLGNGTTTNSSSPICISDISGNALNGKIVTYLKHGLALDSDGKVYTWGYNRGGELGNGTTTNSSSPICISDISGSALNNQHITTIVNSNGSIIALDDSGKVYTWGNNYFGELGNGTTTNSNIPICISDITDNALYNKNIIEITNCNDGIAAKDNTSKLYIWGAGIKTPILNTDCTDSKYNNIKEIKQNGYIIITNDNEIYYELNIVLE